MRTPPIPLILLPIHLQTVTFTPKYSGSPLPQILSIRVSRPQFRIPSHLFPRRREHGCEIAPCPFTLIPQSHRKTACPTPTPTSPSTIRSRHPIDTLPAAHHWRRCNPGTQTWARSPAVSAPCRTLLGGNGALGPDRTGIAVNRRILSPLRHSMTS